jgi:hypothetical protein
LTIVDHAYTRGTGVEWHLDSRITVETDGGTDPHFGVSFIDDGDRCLTVAEVVGDGFEGKEESLLQLGSSQHLRRRLDEDVVLPQTRASPVRIRDGWGVTIC